MTAQAPNPILFLHGWMRNGEDFNTMMDRFKADGWPETMLYAKDFDNSFGCPGQPIINNANKIKQWVDEILDETEAEKIDLVSHSMGGVNSRY
ncbi:MAG: esterase/lipase family protein [Candidatus Hermodarchaeota archaeon]